MAGKAKRRAWTAADVRDLKSFAKKRHLQGNCKIAQANGRRYKTESVLSWSFVGFSRLI
jgi:hypothetical protein